jgi:hypothetical protein
MIKLITPPGMLVTVALLAIYSAYASWTAFIEKSWIYAVVALISFAACVGTAFLKPWSRYPVYVLTVGFVAAWCYSVYAGVQAGFFEFFFSSPAAAAKSLAPGLALACLSLVCSYIVLRHFRPVTQASLDNHPG